ncbi:hypothetical protein BY998_13115 [Methylobacterium sp. B4]|nr:hypothetical protein BY998_13115 [Methylobacterium sp. B4]
MQLIGKPFKREQRAQEVAETLGTNSVLVAGAGNVVALRPRPQV